MVNCCIIDDELHAIELLEKYISRTPGMNLMFSSNDPILALGKIEEVGKNLSLIFSDVEMPGLSGVELAGILSGKNAKIVFTTAFEHFAIQAFEHQVVDFLLKPITYPRFLKSITKFKELYADSIADDIPEYILVPGETRGTKQKIILSSLKYIEAKGNYVSFISEKGKPLLSYLTLNEAAEALPKKKFLQVSRSLILNVDKIESIHALIVTLDTGEQIAIGKAYQAAINDVINKHLIKTKRNG
jgi:DNA-binding LytR/AlgR family response regulator